MDRDISAQYGITYYGLNGTCIIRHGRLVKVFDDFPQQEINWQGAVNWAKDNPNVFAQRPNCECFYCRIMKGEK